MTSSRVLGVAVKYCKCIYLGTRLILEPRSKVPKLKVPNMECSKIVIQSKELPICNTK